MIRMKFFFTGHGELPPSRLPSVQKELLEFLLEESTGSTSKVQNFKACYETCPNLCYFLWLDTESSLEVLRCSFAEKHSNLNIEDQLDISKDANDINLLLQKIVDFLVLILKLNSDEMKTFQVDKNEITESWPVKRDVDHIIEFIACFTAAKRVTISGSVLRYILEYLTLDVNLKAEHSSRTQASEIEKNVISLLKIKSHVDWDTSILLDQCLKAQFFQVTGNRKP